ncbi:MAG: NAD(P)H-binding protein [Ignavibacteria bacterium]|nr:NAD(P)H-binding protein [Ignavibacteria bacterium]
MNIVTGAFGYIGKYITQTLLNKGLKVSTITTHPDKPNPFGAEVKAFKYNFDDPSELIRTLDKADTLFNTYWIRFPYDGQTYEKALKNTEILFNCAKQAGVKRIVQISVTRASLDSELPYYRGKAVQEQILKQCGVPYSIIRPTLVFGKEDILVNNIAWLIRKSPVFPLFGGGSYRVQPVFAEDLAQIAVEETANSPGRTIDAIGPETFTFREFTHLIAKKLNRKILFLSVPSAVGILSGKIIGFFLRDVLLTKNELKGLMKEKLTSEQAPNGITKFSDWLQQNNSILGSSYSSEIARHFRWRNV